MKHAPYYSVKALFLAVALLFMPLSFANAQLPFGGFITIMYTGACTASAPQATPFYLAGPAGGGPFMYIPGSAVFPYGPPSHPGQAILGLAAGFYPCLMWATCGFVPCAIPFPAHPGGLLVIMSGTSQ